MFSRCRQPAQSLARAFSTAKSNHTKVAVLGAAGGIGQPLSMLLKVNPAITQLHLYDIVNTPGVDADLSHIETKAKADHFDYKLCVGVVSQLGPVGGLEPSMPTVTIPPDPIPDFLLFLLRSHRLLLLSNLLLARVSCPGKQS